MIHKETIKAMDTGSRSSMTLATLVVFSLVAIVGLCNFIYNRVGTPYISYVAFILYVLIGIYIYKRKLREYRYCIIDDELLFEQIVGTKIKPIVNVKLSNIKYFCRLSEEKKNDIKCDRNYFLLFKKNSPNAYVLLAKQGKNTIRIIFEPSDELVNLIRKG